MSDAPSRIQAFLAELRERRVFRVAAAYAAAALVILEAASLIVDALPVLPDWTMTLLVVLAALGFPVAVVLAWAFQVTREGVERMSPSEGAPEPGATATPASVGAGGAGRIAVIGAVAVLAVAGGAWWFAGSDAGGASAGAEPNSVAVLPFENMSANEKNAYFTAGIHEAILTQLAAVEALQVISRTSVMQYAETEKTIPQIARELDVATIVEGSVQRINNRVRITAQLIDARSDEHLWADHYERALTAENIFDIQSAVARQIVAALEAELTPEERERIEAQPTDDLAAYNFYLRAREYHTRPGFNPENWRAAIQLYRRAIAEDSSFALARARLSIVHSAMYWFAFDRTEERLERAKRAAERALALAPALPWAHVAMGYYHYRGRRDWRRALEYFRTARDGLPNNASIIAAIAYAQRRLGQWERAIANLERATELDPRNALGFYSLAQTYAAVGRFRDAAHALNRALTLAPDFHGARFVKGTLYTVWTGTVDSLEAVLERMPPGYDPWGAITIERFWLRMSRRDYEGALRALEALPPSGVRTQAIIAPTALLRGIVYEARGDTARARGYFRSALDALEAAVRKRPDDPRLHAALGLVHARLGHKSKAVRHGKQAVALLPVSEDALMGPKYVLELAAIYTLVGEEERALGVLAQLQTISASHRLHLRLRPRWDPLRGEPRFQRLLDTGAPRP